MRREVKSSIRVAGLVLVLALLLVIAVATTTILKLQRRLASAQAALARLEESLPGDSAGLFELLRDPERVGDLRSAAATLDTDLSEVRRLIGPFLPLSPYMGWLPGIGGDVEAAPHLLTIAQQTTKTAQSETDALIPLMEHLHRAEGGIGRLGPELVHGLAEVRPQVEDAKAALSDAVEARAALDASKLSPQSQSMVNRFDRYRPALANSLGAVAIVPELLGADGPRVYLLLAQNNHELRATGGFISGVGLVTVAGGEITELHFQDSYSVDDLTKPHPPPPEPLRRYMGAGMLLLRDANWWPDFPTSARTVADLYRQDQGRQVDGVIAMDLDTLRLLLQVLGPLHIPGYEELVSSDNLQSMIMSYWEGPRLTAPGKEGTDWWLHRKDFAADLTQAILTYLAEHATIDDLSELVRVIGRALRERHLLIFLNNPEAASVFREMAWDGALQPADTASEAVLPVPAHWAGRSDYLMIVDSNVGFNKANANVEQTVDLQVELGEAGEAASRLILTYRHRIQRPSPACVHESYYGERYADLMERCYWDYLRIYLPADSELIELIGTDEPPQVYQESGRTVIGTSFLLEVGGARQIQIVYRPALRPAQCAGTGITASQAVPLVSGHYALWIQKQPGTDALPLRVSLIPPHGRQPTSAAPVGMAWLDGRAVWQGDLAQDRGFELSWK